MESMVINAVKANEERLCNMFDVEVLKYSLLNYANFSTDLLNEAERNKWRNMIKQTFMKHEKHAVATTATTNGHNFPRCVLNEKQLLSMARDLECQFPLKIYTTGRHIHRSVGPTTEKNDEYNSMSAHDCIVEPLRVEGFGMMNIPFLVRMRLLYIPNDDNWICISYTGRGYTRFIKRIDDRTKCAYDDIGRNTFMSRMHFIPFEVIRWISTHEPNDERNDLLPDYGVYSKTWRNMITFNMTGND